LISIRVYFEYWGGHRIDLEPSRVGTSLPGWGTFSVVFGYRIRKLYAGFCFIGDWLGRRKNISTWHSDLNGSRHSNRYIVTIGHAVLSREMPHSWPESMSRIWSIPWRGECLREILQRYLPKGPACGGCALCLETHLVSLAVLLGEFSKFGYKGAHPIQCHFTKSLIVSLSVRRTILPLPQF